MKQNQVLTENGITNCFQDVQSMNILIRPDWQLKKNGKKESKEKSGRKEPESYKSRRVGL
ncbi:MAG: hypothetical protein JWN56_2844 [Sphingobacteriales bacterium]|nr:hypothetical protein [Sphingobacteriales bacterium]